MSAHTPFDDTPIENLDQLVTFMDKGSKPKERWLIGTEHEKIGWSTLDGRRPSYGGPHGIGRLLSALEQEGWTPTYEGVAMIALSKDKASITLEPGGQLELSGAPLKTLAEMSLELDDHLLEIARLSAPLGLIWSGLGSDPTAPNLTPKMPKSRYDIMRRYLPTRGALAAHMMHSTCTSQSNLDFSSEADAMKKLRFALYLQPIVMASFANSFLLDGALRSGNCARSQIWLNTDTDRYLYPEHFLSERATFMDYVRWVIDVPMFFISRDHKYIDCAGLPFSQFMREGFHGHSANMGDFELHLSTIFPDARLKQHIEVRGADMSTPAYTKALSALHVGLLYDEQSLDEGLASFEGVSAQALWTARAELDEQGLKTQLAGESLLTRSQKLVELARSGLSRWEPQSLHLLDPLVTQLERGQIPADLNRTYWKQGVEVLMRETRVA